VGTIIVSCLLFWLVCWVVGKIMKHEEIVASGRASTSRVVTAAVIALLVMFGVFRLLI
jgi:hypothetical protein